MTHVRRVLKAGGFIMKKGYLFITMLLLSCLFLAACSVGGRPGAPAESETVQGESSTEDAVSTKSKT